MTTIGRGFRILEPTPHHSKNASPTASAMMRMLRTQIEIVTNERVRPDSLMYANTARPNPPIPTPRPPIILS